MKSGPKGVLWNNVRLTPGSHALELYESNQLRKLEQHMSQLEEQAKQRGETPYSYSHRRSAITPVQR